MFRGQIFRCVEQPQKSLPAHARGRVASTIPGRDLLFPRAFVVCPDRLLNLRIADYQNRQRCMLPPLGAQTPASRIFRINSFGTESGFNRRIDRVVLMISNRSLLLVCSGMMSSLMRD